MSLTRKFLTEKLGLESDAVEQIIMAHTETVNGLKEQIDDYDKLKKKAQKLEETEKELADLKAEVAKNSDKDYDSLKKEFDDYKADIERKQVRAEKEKAYKAILADAGIPEKHHAKILKYSDVDAVELDEKGNIKTAKDIMKSIVAEWGDHIETTGKKGADTSTPPVNASNKTLSKEEIMKIKDSTERQKAIAENHELFGF